MNINSDTVMLFQGDSITDGNRTRNTDRNHIMGHGYQYLIASEIGAKYYTQCPVFINRGVSGDSVGRLYDRWQDDTIAEKPNIVNILIGVNDILTDFKHTDDKVGTPGDFFDGIYRNIIDDTLNKLPGVEIILLEPFYLPWKKEELSFKRHNTVLDYARCVKKIAEDYGFVFVELQKMFEEKAKNTDPEYLIWDEVHPTIVGHRMIADRWFEVMTEKGGLIL